MYITTTIVPTGLKRSPRIPVSPNRQLWSRYESTYTDNVTMRITELII